MKHHQKPCRVSYFEFCAWIERATPGSRLEYHQGSLAVDSDPTRSKLPDAQRQELCEVRCRAYRAAAEGAVNLVQRRIGPNLFSYVAIISGRRSAALVAKAVDGEIARRPSLPGSGE